MNRNRLAFYRSVLVSTLLLSSTGLQGKSIEDKNWFLVQTDHFEIYSTLGKKKSIDLGHHLELFKRAVEIQTNIKDTQSVIPTRIFAFRGAGDYYDFGFPTNSAGVFIPGIRENTIVLRDVRGMSEAAIIMHEYVHFLVRNNSKFHYPKWYDEGFAEYLSGAGIKRKKFEIGAVQEVRLKDLAYSVWVPMAEVLSPEDYDEWSDRKQSAFYAEAWALVHYLIHASDRRASFARDMQTYLHEIESGTDSLAAFEKAFVIEADDLNGKIKSYLRKGKFEYFWIEAKQLIPDFQPVVSEIPRAKISLALGQLALRRYKLEQAERLFRIAAEDEQLRAKATAGLGDVRKFSADFDNALPYFQEAIELAPDDPYVQLDMAEYWHDLAHGEEDADSRAAHLDKAREYYVAAWKLDDQKPEIYAMYGQTFLMDGDRYDKAVEMLEGAHLLLPSHLGIRIDLADAYAGLGRNADAAEFATTVLAWSHGESAIATRARNLLEKLATDPDQANVE